MKKLVYGLIVIMYVISMIFIVLILTGAFRSSHGNKIAVKIPDNVNNVKSLTISNEGKFFSLMEMSLKDENGNILDSDSIAVASYYGYQCLSEPENEKCIYDKNIFYNAQNLYDGDTSTEVMPDPNDSKKYIRVYLRGNPTLSEIDLYSKNIKNFSNGKITIYHDVNGTIKKKYVHFNA